MAVIHVLCVCVMHHSDGLFTVKLDLEPGDYQYKFVVDGDWKESPHQVNFYQLTDA